MLSRQRKPMKIHYFDIDVTYREVKISYHFCIPYLT